jgi:chromosome segregation ATPase
VDARTVAFLRELRRADDEAAATLAELDELAREVEAIGARAGEVEARLAVLPAEREGAETAVADAEREIGERLGEHERATAAVTDADRANDGERLRAARRAEVRARDRLRMAERRAAHRRERAAQLEREAQSSAAEAGALGERARVVAAALRARPAVADQTGEPPDEALAALADWATQARAALFVARGRLAAEREAVIRQANELGAAVLGESLPAQSAALVARRVEQGRLS